MKRRGLICTLIAFAAVTIITITAVIRVSGGDEPRHAAAENAVALGVTTSTLTETELKSAVGDDALVTISHFGRLAETPAKVDPPGCEGVSAVLPAGVLSGVDWVAFRGTMASSPQQAKKSH